MEDTCQCEVESAPVSSEVEETMRWYAVQVVSGLEARVQTAIGKSASRSGVEKYIGQILFPIEKISEIRNGRKCTHSRKLYPGYLFMQLDLYDETGDTRHELWQFIRSINGVLGLLGGDKPAHMKQKDIDLIIQQTQSGEKSEKFRSSYSVGMLVKVVDGPFAGSEGEVGSLDEKLGRACINVSLFGRLTPVDLEFWQIAKKEV
jgi:transcriptional antiterminator NusG